MKTMILLVLMFSCLNCGQSNTFHFVPLSTDTIALLFNESDTIWQCEDQLSDDNLSFQLFKDGTGFSGDSLLAVFEWQQTGVHSIMSVSGPFIPITANWIKITEINSTQVSLMLIFSPGELVLELICDLEQIT